MRNVEYLQRRAHIAACEAQDADRVWRRAMQPGTDSMAADADVLWQERELAHSRLRELRLMVDAEHRRREKIVSARQRLRGARQMLAFLLWQAGAR